jgi:ribosomal protein S18 acetylase RimI-like enzyme
VADLHAAQIDQGFLSLLGPTFLARLYRRIVASPGSFLLVAEEEPGSGVIGFIAGSEDIGRLYRSFLLRDGVLAALETAPVLVRRWRRVTETLRHGMGDGDGTGRGAELLAVAVAPGRQGGGVGTALVRDFLTEVVRRGGNQAYVVVVADNPKAVGLYEHAGFATSVRFELHAGTESLLMQWNRSDGEDGPEGSV